MKNVRFLMLSLVMAFAIIVSSCKKDDPVNEAQVLTEFVESVITPATLPAYITASDLYQDNLLGKDYIIDVRSAADFNDGHIANAHNVSLADILDHVQNNDLTSYEKIVVACYTGQSAAWGSALLRSMGYSNVYSLKFGMSSWHPDFDKWTTNVGNTYFSQFETTANAKAAAGDLPEVSTGFENGEDIRDARVKAIFAEGFSGTTCAVTAATVFGDLDGYYIINYWPEADYTDPGHIPGAIDYIPGSSLTLDTDLKTLPTDKPVVVYCYTGQTSAFITAYLRMLGYDARTLKFGANSMIYDNMPKAKWTTLTQGYDYVTTK